MNKEILTETIVSLRMTAFKIEQLIKKADKTLKINGGNNDGKKINKVKF